MSKLVEELRLRVQEVYAYAGVTPFTASLRDVVALLAHIERLEADNERLKAERNEMALDQVTRAMIKATQQADKGE